MAWDEETWRRLNVMHPSCKPTFEMVPTTSLYTVANWTQCLCSWQGDLYSGHGDNVIRRWNWPVAGSSTLLVPTSLSPQHASTVKQFRVWQGTLCSASYDQKIKRWVNGVETGELRGHTAGIMCMTTWHENLVSGSYDGAIKLWDTDGSCLLTFTEHTAAVSVLKIWRTTLNGKKQDLLVSGSHDDDVKVWNIEGSILTLTGHTARVNCVKVWKERNLLVSTSNDCTARLWNIEGACVQVIQHAKRVTCAKIWNKLLFTASPKIQVHDARGKLVKTLDSDGFETSDLKVWRGMLISSGHHSHKVCVWNDLLQCIASLVAPVRWTGCLGSWGESHLVVATASGLVLWRCRLAGQEPAEKSA